MRPSEVIMPVGVVIGVVIVFVLVATAAALAGTLVLRMAGLRHQFGPEYNRLVREVGVRQAQAELADRRRRVAGLGLRPLTVEQRARYSGEWRAVQERFVDRPPESVRAAARLVAAVAADRGYQVGDRAQLVKDLSVHHARRLEGYRRASQADEQAAAETEQLRQAMLGYRALFRELLGTTEAVVARPLTKSGATAAGGARQQSLPSPALAKSPAPAASPASPASPARPVMTTKFTPVIHASTSSKSTTSKESRR